MRHCVAQWASSVHYSPIKHKGCQQIQESLSRSVNLMGGKRKHLRMGKGPWRSVLVGAAVPPQCEPQVGLKAASGSFGNQSEMGDTFSHGTMLCQVDRQSQSPKTTHKVLQRVCMWHNNTELSLNSTCEIAISIMVKMRTCCGSKLANVTTELAANANSDYGYMKKLAFKECENKLITRPTNNVWWSLDGEKNQRKDETYESKYNPR